MTSASYPRSASRGATAQRAASRVPLFLYESLADLRQAAHRKRRNAALTLAGTGGASNQKPVAHCRGIGGTNMSWADVKFNLTSAHVPPTPKPRATLTVGDAS
jgi:hypothetical protein